ncbi:hypothetical protein GCM10009858_29590 [Terrabacter carboxydivorans]|uniref:LysM domain-containing protein n=2 Tax=Terrabacter carboxydivorans TaxID=619730 RepID=A0ABN3LST8_9MICO
MGSGRAHTRRPRERRTARELAGALLGLGLAAAALTLFATLVRQAPGLSAATRPDDVLLVLLGWVGLLLAAWLALGSLLAVAALSPGAVGRAAAGVADRVTPVAVRKTLALALGASVGSLALPPALVSVAGSGPVGRSTGAHEPDARTTGTGPSLGLAPGFTPTEAVPGFTPSTDAGRGVAAPPAAPAPRPPDGPGYAPTAPDAGPASTGRADRVRARGTTVSRTASGPGYVPSAPPAVHDADRSRLMAPTPRVTTAAHDLVTVRRGDSLWSVAARYLGSSATDAEVAREWPRWYAANRDVVGDDPDLLTPGQLLRPPDAVVGSSAVRHPSASAAGPEAGATAQQGDQ